MLVLVRGRVNLVLEPGKKRIFFSFLFFLVLIRTTLKRVYCFFHMTVVDVKSGHVYQLLTEKSGDNQQENRQKTCRHTGRETDMNMEDYARL